MWRHSSIFPSYVRLSWLREVYESRCHARRWIVAAHAYLLHLVGCTLFSNKSATKVHVVHLEGFRDLGQAGGYAWGAAALVHMYDQLNEACQTPTRQMAGYLTLLQCWIYEHFPSVHQCVTDDAYAETTPRASQWLTTKAHMRGIRGVSYRARSAEMGSYCGLCSTREGGPTIRISHMFVTPTQAGDQPRHPPAPQDEEYVEPHIPEVPVASDLPRHSVDACEGCEAIAERLERVLNLRMITEGTELHEIMQDCLRIARGDASSGSLRARRKRRIDH
ncbi:uncharacterized protein LOC114398623 [Glycine soja]|uniref:uncharacterized protein LOC114398623 n=1 Tax=Glycine soja TaxID=3848 RepID=UPI00103E4D84|nr:uncharacterized protein LOC114398623 [Glycine soja]